MAPEAAEELCAQDGAGGPSHRVSRRHPPPAPVLQAHIEAVHADWKEYLNLLICEESHLKFMEDFHKVPEPWGHKAQPRESPEHEQAPAARETG